jgi:hypothetical protein
LILFILDEDIIWFGNIFSDIIVVDSKINSRMLIHTKQQWPDAKTTPTMTILAVWLFDNNAELRCSNLIVGFKTPLKSNRVKFANLLGEKRPRRRRFSPLRNICRG